MDADLAMRERKNGFRFHTPDLANIKPAIPASQLLNAVDEVLASALRIPSPVCPNPIPRPERTVQQVPGVQPNRLRARYCLVNLTYPRSRSGLAYRN